MQEISLQQAQLILLEMGKEFDRICTKNDISYFMIGGTLLGAVRHKGFIPWDDDMDFGIPIEQYGNLIEALERELHEPYRLCTYQGVEGCRTVYAKIDDVRTCIRDKCVNLPLKKQLGINIDLFPLFHCDKGDGCLMQLRFLQKFNQLVFTESTKGQQYKHLLKRLLQVIIPVEQNVLLSKLWKLALQVEGTDCMANLFGQAGEREYIANEIYGVPARYQFEDASFLGPQYADRYLTQIYGDYLELPPVEKRMLHTGGIYWR